MEISYLCSKSVNVMFFSPDGTVSGREGGGGGGGDLSASGAAEKFCPGGQVELARQR